MLLPHVWTEISLESIYLQLKALMEKQWQWQITGMKEKEYEPVASFSNK